MNVYKIVKEWLKEHKYNGLVNTDCNCCCHFNNLFPCCTFFDNCEAGRIQKDRLRYIKSLEKRRSCSNG